MPSPLDYPDFRRFIVNNAITSGVFPLSEMTVMWLFYVNLHNLLLFSLVASSRVISRIVVSPIAGYLGDRYDRGKVLFVTKAISPAFLVVLALLMGYHMYLAGLAVVYARAFNSEMSTQTGSASIVTMVPKELMSRAIFINRSFKEPSTLAGTLAWPFLLNYLGPYVLFISATALAISLPLVRNLRINQGKKEVNLLTGFKIFITRPEARGAILGLAVDQAAISFLINYTPLLVSLEGGTQIFYSLAQAAFYVGIFFGSYVVTKLKSSSLMDLINLVLKVSLFPPLLLHTPWALLYSMFALTFADANLEIMWFRALRKGAGDEYLTSIIGVDELMTNVGRITVLEIVPLILTAGLFPLVGLGLALIGVEGIIHLLHKQILDIEK
ncbi:MFS transporter [Metallosphaera javensis (ex Sakai et al. 2022)]|uniref:MFS transporter n=1 Tax=Metallosphaera javensis (ex Sakai et al. 2022) TaxID=2775498 RepID=UPI00258748CD